MQLTTNRHGSAVPPAPLPDPGTDHAPQTTARVTYQITVSGATHSVTASITTAGSAAEAALKLAHPVAADAKEWLQEQRKDSSAAPRRGLPRRRFRARGVEPAAKLKTGAITATARIGDKEHRYTAEFEANSSPLRAASAALQAAASDLWDWAWEERHR
jgi:hypothetical protein